MDKSFQASIDELHKMLNFIRRELKVAGFEGDLETQVELALEEAIVNIIKHGYKNSSGNIEIRCLKLNEGIEVTLIDNGIPFNPLSKSDTFASPQSNSMGGYGIYLIKKIMSKVEYMRNNDQNCLKLTKFFNS
jgi:anti-sigma regulatory factor (Ser/Thr protein kinase)